MHCKTNVKPFYVWFPLDYNQSYLNALGFDPPVCSGGFFLQPRKEEN